MNMNENISLTVQECSAWKRTLEFLLQENTFLKTILTDYINTLEPGENSIKMAEHFQQAFISNDDIILFLRSEVTSLQQLLLKETMTGRIVHQEIKTQQWTIRKSMKMIETTFIELKFKFNNYLSEVA